MDTWNLHKVCWCPSRVRPGVWRPISNRQLRRRPRHTWCAALNSAPVARPKCLVNEQNHIRCNTNKATNESVPQKQQQQQHQPQDKRATLMCVCSSFRDLYVYGAPTILEIGRKRLCAHIAHKNFYLLYYTDTAYIEGVRGASATGWRPKARSPGNDIRSKRGRRRANDQKLVWLVANMKNVISLGDGKGARFKIIPIFSSYFHHINCCRGSQLPRLACRRIVLSIRSGLAAAASQSPTYLLGYSGGSNTENHTLRQCTHSHTHTILVVVVSYMALQRTHSMLTLLVLYWIGLYMCALVCLPKYAWGFSDCPQPSTCGLTITTKMYSIIIRAQRSGLSQWVHIRV